MVGVPGESSVVFHKKAECLGVNELQRLDVHPKLCREPE